MFWNPIQPGQSKQKEIPLARKPHPQSTPRKPANSNRETILLEPHVTLIKQTTEGSSNREKNATFTSLSTRPHQPDKLRVPPSSIQPQALQPPEPNRQPKLLKTPQLQQNKHPRRVLIGNFCMLSRSNFCRYPGFVALASRRLLRPQFRQVPRPRSEYKRRLRRHRNSEPSTDCAWALRRRRLQVAKSRSSDAGRDAGATRAQIRQTRRKRENPPLNFVAIKRRPDRFF
jgi:hypothetical protein